MNASASVAKLHMLLENFGSGFGRLDRKLVVK